MEFEWDEQKNLANQAKHGISFEEAQAIFDGPVLTFPDARWYSGETREISVGEIAGIVALAVVHTDRSGKVRIVSARRASRHERKLYHDYQSAKAQGPEREE